MRGEWVIRVDGEVKARLAEAVNPNLPTGEIEIFAGEIEVLSAAKELPLPVFGEPEELRRAVYTTNTIEGLHRQIRKAIKTRGHFPDQQAATKLIYLAIMKADAKWQRNRTWTAPRAALKIHFGDRIPD